MRSPILRVVAGLLLLTACGKKKDGPTYGSAGARDAGSAHAGVATVTIERTLRVG